jgi:hypothetical protein
VWQHTLRAEESFAPASLQDNTSLVWQNTPTAEESFAPASLQDNRSIVWQNTPTAEERLAPASLQDNGVSCGRTRRLLKNDLHVLPYKLTPEHGLKGPALCVLNTAHGSVKQSLLMQRILRASQFGDEV